MVTPYKVAEVSVTVRNVKSLVIYLIHLTIAVKFIIVPDLHQTDVGLHKDKLYTWTGDSLRFSEICYWQKYQKMTLISFVDLWKKN